MKRTRPLATKPETVRAFNERARLASKHTRKPISPASKEQREKVRDAVCVNCANTPCDPAHLTARSQGGCDHPDCVVALCRACHREFDSGTRVDLSPILALPEFAAERSHMAFHLDLLSCLHRLSGERWLPESYHYEGWAP